MKLYALIACVSDYPSGVSDLPGCANDADAMRDYLEDYAKINGYDPQVKVLKDADCTRSNLIDAFKHFRQATDTDDICIFYYTGHGAQMPSPREFWHLDRNRLCQTLVCHDSRQPGGRDLADKEVSYLLHENVPEGRQLLTIFDSCHSGSITREAYATPRNAGVNETPVGFKDFYGADNYIEAEGNYKPPQRDHVALSACISRQVAVEMSIEGTSRGLFTYSLIDTLQQIDLKDTSYAEILERVQTRVKNRYPNQQVYGEAINDAGDKISMRSAFLNGKLKLSRRNILDYDVTEGRWFIALGSIHGVGYDDELTYSREGEWKKLPIKEVTPGKSYVFPKDGVLDPAQAPYPVINLQRSGMEKLQISAGQGLSTMFVMELQQAINERFSSALTWSDAPADYQVMTFPNATMGLVRDGDDVERPVFEAVSTKKEDHEGSATYIDVFLTRVAKVGRYQAIRKLAPTYAPLNPEDVLDIKFEEVIVEGGVVVSTEAKDCDGAAVFSYRRLPSGKLRQPRYRLSLKMKDSGYRRLHVGMLYFDESFAIYDSFFPAGEMEMGGEFVTTLSKPKKGDDQVLTYQGLMMSKDLLEWGMTEITNYLKIIVSTEPFPLEEFSQAALAQEQFRSFEGQAKTAPTHRGTKRGAGEEEEDEDFGSRWGVKDIPFVIHRPLEVNTPARKANALVEVETHPHFQFDELIFECSDSNSRSTGDKAMPKLDLSAFNVEPVTLYNTRSAMPLDMAKMMGPENPESVNVDQPLLINKSIAEDEQLLVFALDEPTGRYYPVGASTEDGKKIRVDQLPPATEDPNTRSFGGSVKLFFRKVVKETVQGETFKGLLRKVTVDAEGKITHHDDLGSLDIAKVMDKPETKRVALFIHGIIGDTYVSPVLLNSAVHPVSKKKLGEHYDLALTFDYENLGTDIPTNAKHLADQLSDIGLKLDSPHAGKTFDVYAHSMGGLVSRYYIEQLHGDKLVNNLIQFGTPNNGSPLPSYYSWAVLGITRLINGASVAKPFFAPFFQGAKWFLESTQEGLDDMKNGSTFLKDLNDPKVEKSISYHLINGNIRLIEKAEEEVAFFKRIMRRFNLHNILDTVFGEPSDIAVSTKSQRHIPGVEVDPVMVASDHLSYFTDPSSIEGFEGLMPKLLD